MNADVVHVTGRVEEVRARASDRWRRCRTRHGDTLAGAPRRLSGHQWDAPTIPPADQFSPIRAPTTPSMPCGAPRRLWPRGRCTPRPLSLSPVPAVSLARNSRNRPDNTRTSAPAPRRTAEHPRGVPERDDDVPQHAAHPDAGINQVDSHVPGGVEGRGSRGQRQSCRADLAGDHPDCALVDAPGDVGDCLAVAGVACSIPGARSRPNGIPVNPQCYCSR